MLDKIKQQQYVLLWGVIAVLAVAFCIVLSLLCSSKSDINWQKQLPKKHLTTGASRINQQDMWVHDFSAKAEITQKRLEAMEQTLEKLLKLNTISTTTANNDKAPITAVENLKKDLAVVHQASSDHQNINNLPAQPATSFSGSTSVLVKQNIFKSKDLKKISLNLNRSRNNKPLKTTDNIVPAGAFAEAVLLGGVDASTSIQASSDPRPILLRLTNPGTLPRRFTSDLEGCHALAASYGDISSERVFMRLEKLSCVERKTGEVIEMSIQGYVAGEDGRAGIRGAIVDRAGASMRNAMVGGFFSSIGKFLGQARSPLIFSPTTGLAENNPLTTKEILKHSAGSGVSGALDKYADFYIKRAEQMQPVIQVAAGRTVDIVFTQGVEFADSTMRQMLSKTNDQQRYQQVQTLEETKAVQAWLPKNQGDQE